jgi:hypothetical protein
MSRVAWFAINDFLPQRSGGREVACRDILQRIEHFDRAWRESLFHTPLSKGISRFGSTVVIVYPN